MTTFLTPDELATLTGYRLPAKQIAWLRAYRWRYAVNGAGHPRVARAYFEARMVGEKEMAAPTVSSRPRMELVK